MACAGARYKLVCSTINFLHDLSLGRRKSDWFLSKIYAKNFSTKGKSFF